MTPSTVVAGTFQAPVDAQGAQPNTAATGLPQSLMRNDGAGGA